MRRLTLPERHDWRKTAEKMGFTFHTAGGERYWDESAAYAFSLAEIEEGIEAPVTELEQMALYFVGEAVKSEEALTRLAIPRAYWATIYDSWMRGDRNLYGRFDFAFDGKGPAKLLEYNADTPTALFETGVFQWVWLEEQIARGVLPQGADQFNSVHERLVEAFQNLRGGAPYHLHLTCMRDTTEDRGTVVYLEECAQQAGLSTQFLYVDEIGLTRDGAFVDLANAPIDVLFKLYPWEWMLREEFGKAVPRSSTQFIEPIWKALLSNKGLLPFLWKLAPNHPNLLPAFFADEDASALGGNFVEKPLLSREGANIRIVKNGIANVANTGPYGAEGFIRQGLAELPNLGGGYAILGAWVVASQPAGMLVREDLSPITGNSARFVPHFIEN